MKLAKNYWTDREEKILMKAIKEKKSFEEISLTLSRSIASIKSKVGWINKREFENIEKCRKEAKHIIDEYSLALSIVSDFFDISSSLIVSKTRKREILYCRQIVHYLLLNYTLLSSSEIGKNVGGKDHATVLNSSKSVKNLISTDKLFSKGLVEIEKRFLIGLDKNDFRKIKEEELKEIKEVKKCITSIHGKIAFNNFVKKKRENGYRKIS